MQDLVIWAGPVAKFQVPGATVEGAREKFFVCQGDGNPSCSAIVASYSDAERRRLPGVVRACGTSLDQTGDIFLGAFSAGGGFLRGLVQSEVDRPLVRAMMLADATYSGAWVDKRNRIPLVNDFWLQWGEHVLRSQGKQMWIATASPSPNGEMASGVETLAEIRRQLELRTGRAFKKLNHFWGVDPGPTDAYQLDTIIFAEYPMDPLGHGGHTKIAPQVWNQIMLPWLTALRQGKRWPPEADVPPVLDDKEPTIDETDKPFTALPWIILGSAASAGFFFVRWWSSRRRKGSV